MLERIQNPEIWGKLPVFPSVEYRCMLVRPVKRFHGQKTASLAATRVITSSV